MLINSVFLSHCVRARDGDPCGHTRVEVTSELVQGGWWLPGDHTGTATGVGVRTRWATDAVQPSGSAKPRN
ncbi:hypothetical protein Ahu01nite_042320 [Winogradskya humida]|uniref:Uncharacterized protein n=1 Tax=Winogradskya humida TaxID=113566 RepID=A0ABQ3ZRC2_9ACTN|nr:hypothetical protein Ahu01nite_042320 [Actinoplanes humidus]